MTSGWSALLLCIILGPRIGFGKKSMSPHSMVLCAVGTGMLWVGWYGFNAGSALASDGVAAQAFTTTTLAAAVAAFTWGALEWVLRKHASVLGICSGAVAGLVVVTPAAGFVSTTSAVIIGVLAGVVPFLAVVYLKSKLGYDDALDTFGVHAVGGTLGAVLTGIFATIDANANLGLNLKDVVGNTLLTEQFKAIGVTLALSLVATAIIAYTLKATIGLRPTEEDEARGLDISDHGEEGYNHNS
jgi:Amt family ammonium transporter